MTTLKTDFSIDVNDDNIASIVLALKALGYEIYSDTYESVVYCNSGVQHYKSIITITTINGSELCRGTGGASRKNNFTNFNDFLKWHFSEDKSEAEKELDTLQQKMDDLQKQINVIRQREGN